MVGIGNTSQGGGPIVGCHDRVGLGCPKPEPIPPVPHDAEIVKEKTVVIKETVVVIVKEPSDTVAAAKAGCAWVRGYTRGDGTEVKAHQRCAMR